MLQIIIFIFSAAPPTVEPPTNVVTIISYTVIGLLLVALLLVVMYWFYDRRKIALFNEVRVVYYNYCGFFCDNFCCLIYIFWACFHVLLLFTVGGEYYDSLLFFNNVEIYHRRLKSLKQIFL